MLENHIQLRIGTATAVVQYHIDSDAHSAALAGAFQHALDSDANVRRIGDITIHRPNSDTVELRSDVEYGPVRAKWGDMRRHAERYVRAAAAAVADATCIGVLVHSLAGDDILTPEQHDAVIGKLTVELNDCNLSIPRRKEVAKTLARLRTAQRKAAHLRNASVTEAAA